MLKALASTLRKTQVLGAQRSLTSVAAGLNLPAKFGHFIGGEFVEPVAGEYFDNVSPIDGKTFIQAARGTTSDVDAAVAVANAAYTSTWSKASVTERSNVLLKIAGLALALIPTLALA